MNGFEISAIIASSAFALGVVYVIIQSIIDSRWKP